MKLSFRFYYEPTPKIIRKLADCLLGASAMISTSSIMQDYRWIAIAALSTGVVGKFLSNFFAEDNQHVDISS